MSKQTEENNTTYTHRDTKKQSSIHFQ